MKLQITMETEPGIKIALSHDREFIFLTLEDNDSPSYLTISEAQQLASYIHDICRIVQDNQYRALSGFGDAGKTIEDFVKEG